MRYMVKAFVALLFLITMPANLQAGEDLKYFVDHLGKLSVKEFGELFQQEYKDAGYPKVTAGIGIEFFDREIPSSQIEQWNNYPARERFIFAGSIVVLRLDKEKKSNNNKNPHSSTFQVETLYVLSCLNTASNIFRAINNSMKKHAVTDTVDSILVTCLTGNSLAIK